MKKKDGKDLLKSISNIRDFRQSGKIEYFLSDLILIGLFTLLCNGHDYEDMVLYWEKNGKKLKGYLKRPNKVPSSDTFNRVFSTLEPSALIDVLCQYGETFIDILSEKQICIDGKKLRGSCPKGRGGRGIYLVNAWISENRLCIGQEKVAEKSNEITAIPKVLSSLNIEGSVISLDSIGCQQNIVNQICDQGADYLIALKGNQGTLLQDVEAAFQLDERKIEASLCMEEENGGRKESRKCSILEAKSVLPEQQLYKWKNLATLVRIESIRNGQQEQRFYISSEKYVEKINNPMYFNTLVRGHWSIENHLHWHLDVVFREDNSRIRDEYAAQNIAILRKLALQIIQNSKKHFNLSMQKIRYLISIDSDSFIELLNLANI